MSVKDRGFASMDPEKHRRIAQQGGRTAHLRGKAHKWTSTEASAAGRKGAQIRLARRSVSSGPESGSRALPDSPELWRLRSADGRVLHCLIVRAGHALEVHLGYAGEPIAISGGLATMAAALETADLWRSALLDKGNFFEVAESEQSQPAQTPSQTRAS